MRKREYEPREVHTEDTTRGNSRIDPVNYKGDVLTQAWIDSRVLATLMIWMDGEGVRAMTLL